MRRTPQEALLIWLIVAFGVAAAARAADPKPTTRPARGGFTGPGVPALAAMRGDYVNVGVRTAERQTDIPRLMAALRKIHATDYMHLVWTQRRYPGGWKDFNRLAPVFQKAGLRLWLYLTPPSEGVPEPFGGDYVRWATECGRIAKKHPCVAGICIDDFNGNVRTFTPAYCRKMMAAAHEDAAHLALLVVCYYGYYARTIGPHIEAGAIDGVIFPYFYPLGNHSDTSRLLPQIRAYRTWLDARTAKGGLTGTMPLVVMVYASKHSASRDRPTPAYVKRCLQIGLQATAAGLADGAVTYCLPKDKPAFLEAAAAAYKRPAGTGKTE